MRSMSSSSNRPATAGDAVDLAVRLLRVQVDLAGCRAEVVERDAFVAGYLWGFCGGVLDALGVRSHGLAPMFGAVARELFGERDGARLLARVRRVLAQPAFEDGEAAGLTDARRSVQTDRASIGLVAHLSGGLAGAGGEADGA